MLRYRFILLAQVLGADGSRWQTSSCETHAMRTLTISELVEVFYDRLWNCWDDAVVDECLDDDFRFRGSLGQETTGRQAWRGYRDMIRAGAPDFYNEVVSLVAEADQAAVRLRYSGTHLGTMLDLPASGRRFVYDGAAFFTAEHGRLTTAWVLGDIDSLRRQLSTNLR